MQSSTIVSIASVTVAIVVALVQYAQWRTANQKVVVDLYDRRLRIFQQLEGAIAPVMREAEVNADAFQNFAIGQAESRFLFGDDVKEYLQTLRESFAWPMAFTNTVIDHSEDRENLVNTKYDHIKRIVDFYSKGPELFAPYIKLEHKNTPFWRPW
ncbi:MAG: hypothetical protein JSR72_23045 [Proteobacteria bacterium]|nr:hypothetical protein [Pseudomonadota bacterium]